MHNVSPLLIFFLQYLIAVIQVTIIVLLIWNVNCFPGILGKNNADIYDADFIVIMLVG